MDVTAFGFREGRGEVVFGDGVRLMVVPERREGEILAVASVRVVDAEGTAAEALVSGNPGSGTFWSRGGWTQPRVGERLRAAIDAERAVYRQYRAGRIDETMWRERFRDFWKVTIKAHLLCEALCGGRLPDREGPLPDRG